MARINYHLLVHAARTTTRTLSVVLISESRVLKPNNWNRMVVSFFIFLKRKPTI